jgi:hypothetical protein
MADTGQQTTPSQTASTKMGASLLVSDENQPVFAEARRLKRLDELGEAQRATLGFFMFLALALVWIGNGVLMDPLWQTAKVGKNHVMVLRKDTQVGMIKMFTILYWIFMVMTLVMGILSIKYSQGDYAPGQKPRSGGFIMGIFYLCLFGLALAGACGAGFLTSKAWKAKTDPANPKQVLLSFTRGQLTCVKIMAVLIWADIIFAAFLYVWHTHKLK